MMEMGAVNEDIVKGAPGVAVNGVSQGERQGKRDEEADSRQEKPALRPIANMQMKKFADFRIVKEQKDDGDGYENRQTEQPGLGQHDSRLLLVPNGTLAVGRTREVYI